MREHRRRRGFLDAIGETSTLSRKPRRHRGNLEHRWAPWRDVAVVRFQFWLRALLLRKGDPEPASAFSDLRHIPGLRHAEGASRGTPMDTTPVPRGGFVRFNHHQLNAWGDTPIAWFDGINHHQVGFGGEGVESSE